MLRYAVRRLLWMVPLLFVIVTFSFFMMRIAPGGPFASERVLPATIRANIERAYHLDEPLWAQYLRYMGNLARGDLGPSFKYPDRTVNEMILERVPVSAQLGFWALAIALLIGIPAGIIGALRQNTAGDYGAMSFAMLGVSIPNFVLGPVLILVFAVSLRWLPTNGWGTPAHLVMPALTLGTFFAAYIARLTRSGLLEVIRQDYIRTARAKGLYERVVLTRHALRVGLLPVVSFLGPGAAGLLTGTVVVERIFNIPGIGRDFVTAAFNRDYTLVMGTVLFYSIVLVLFNLLVDLAYGFLDPRVKYD